MKAARFTRPFGLADLLCGRARRIRGEIRARARRGPCETRIGRWRPMREEVLTVQEVAKLLKTTPATVYAWCRAGKIPAFKIGQQWRIRGGALDRMMSDGASPAPDSVEAGWPMV